MRKILFFIVGILFGLNLFAQDANYQMIKDVDVQCPDGATFSQFPIFADGVFSIGNYKEMAQMITDVNSIETVRFFCYNENNASIKIVVFENNNGEPGNEIISFDNIEVTPIQTEYDDIKYWDWTPDENITDLPDTFFLGIFQQELNFKWLAEGEYTGGFQKTLFGWNFFKGFTLCIVPQGTDLVDTYTQNNIKIYPNPTKGIVNFDFFDKNVQKVIISDITGKIVIERTSISKNTTFDFSNLENGVYIAEIQSDNQSFTVRIVKE